MHASIDQLCSRYQPFKVLSGKTRACRSKGAQSFYNFQKQFVLDYVTYTLYNKLYSCAKIKFRTTYMLPGGDYSTR
jgi:hypothetical protein